MTSDLADEFDVFSLDVFDDHDLHLGKEVQCQVTHRVPGTQQHAAMSQLSCTASQTTNAAT